MNILTALRRCSLVLACAILPVFPAHAEEEFTIVQMCDTQLGMGGYEHDLDAFEKAVVQINALAPDLVVICGDLVNTASEKSFGDFNRIRAKFTVPCYPAPGNHDVNSAASIDTYRKVIGKDYYAVDHKGYTFVIVNTQIWKKPLDGITAAQDVWFAKTLKESHAKGNKNVVVGHHPLFIKTPEEEDQYYNLPKPTRMGIIKLCVEQGVVAYLAGHAHKNIENEFDGIPMVVSATSSKNFDGAPMGFRVWKMGPKGETSHEFVHIENLDTTIKVPKKK